MVMMQSRPFLGTDGQNGGTCPLPDQHLPQVRGNLLIGEDCATCCPHPQAEDAPDGEQPECEPSGADAWGGNSDVLVQSVTAGGFNPIPVNYAIHLNGAFDQRIVAAQARYRVDAPPGSGATFVDDGGVSVFGTNGYVVNWDAVGIQYLNSKVGEANVPVQATATLTFGGGQVTVHAFIVWWLVSPKPPNVP